MMRSAPSTARPPVCRPAGGRRSWAPGAALALALAACGPGAVASAPDAPAPAGAPGARTARVLSETLDEACAEPALDFCGPWLLRGPGGRHLIEAGAVSVFVQTSLGDTPAGRRMAAALCGHLAALHYDGRGADLGYTHVHVDGAGRVELAACRVGG